MNDFSTLFRLEMQSGASLDEALAHLRQAGATPVSTIKAVREVLEVSLGEAKNIFDASAAWQLEAEAGWQLHEEIFRILEKDQGDAL